MADPAVGLTGVLPLAVAAGVRGYHAATAHRPWRPELLLGVAAAGAAALSGLVQAGLRAASAYQVAPLGTHFTTAAALPRHLPIGLEAVLLFFGAGFFGRAVGLAAGLALVHLAGVALAGAGPGFRPDHWESRADWYDPRQHRANFLILGGAAFCDDATAAQARSAFGRPAGSYRVGRYTVMVWQRNLLTALR